MIRIYNIKIFNTAGTGERVLKTMTFISDGTSGVMCL
jgi:hypothetical protein